jgi:hypothetical protein
MTGMLKESTPGCITYTFSLLIFLTSAQCPTNGWQTIARKLARLVYQLFFNIAYALIASILLCTFVFFREKIGESRWKTYHQQMLFLPKSSKGCTWCGLAVVGCSGGIQSVYVYYLIGPGLINDLEFLGRGGWAPSECKVWIAKNCFRLAMNIYLTA